jgi:hypothetical protein
VSRIENEIRKCATFWVGFAKGFTIMEKAGGMVDGKTGPAIDG